MDALAEHRDEFEHAVEDARAEYEFGLRAALQAARPALLAAAAELRARADSSAALDSPAGVLTAVALPEIGVPEAPAVPPAGYLADWVDHIDAGFVAATDARSLLGVGAVLHEIAAAADGLRPPYRPDGDGRGPRALGPDADPVLPDALRRFRDEVAAALAEGQDPELVVRGAVVMLVHDDADKHFALDARAYAADLGRAWAQAHLAAHDRELRTTVQKVQARYANPIEAFRQRVLVLGRARIGRERGFDALEALVGPVQRGAVVLGCRAAGLLELAAIEDGWTVREPVGPAWIVDALGAIRALGGLTELPEAVAPISFQVLEATPERALSPSV